MSQTGSVDYDAIAKKYGAITSGGDEASQTRQMLVSGLTGMPTPNMTPEQVQQFNKGKAAGALSVPAVAAGAGVATATPGAVAAGASALLPHVVKLGEWAEANPTQAKIALEALKLTAGGAALIKWLKSK